MVRLGGWLFKHRTWLPVPLALAILLTPGPQRGSLGWMAAGFGLVAAGETLRLWGVHYIGVISRTRGERLGPLVADGPFAYIRNPLYVGNVALWVGFACCAQLIWLALLLLFVLGFEYHAIVRWEESLLASRIGAPYAAYAARVPRWLPALKIDRTPENEPGSRLRPTPAFSWRETLFSERGTLAAIAVASLLIWLKARS
jgi:protein-S-isoprenylcysteine O-methyltransferase Ste14